MDIVDPQAKDPLLEPLQKPHSTKEIFFRCMQIAVPSFAFFLAESIQQAYNIHKANQILPPFEANAVGLGSMIFNFFAFSLLLGFMGGFEVLGPNALGQNNPYLMGVYFHRSRIVGAVVAVISYLILFFFCGDIVTFLRVKNVDLTTLQIYVSLYALSVFPEIQMRSCYNYLNITGCSRVNLYSIACSTVVHVVSVEILVEYFGFGLNGIAVSAVISIGFNALFLTVYIHLYRPSPESIFWINSECFNDLKAYFDFSLPNTLMFCSEWWAWEILSFIVSKIGESEYNAHISLALISNGIFAMNLGICQGMVAVIGEFISEGRLKDVKKTVEVCFFTATAVIGSIILTIYFSREAVLTWFIKDEHSFSIAVQFIAVVVAQQLFDAYQTIVNNYMKALGKQFLASCICLVNSYLVQTTLIWFFGLRLEYGLFGVYWAYIFSTVVTMISYIIPASQFDLLELHEETKLRIEEAESNLTTSENSPII